MDKDSKIYVAGHAGMVGSAICRNLKDSGYENIITRGYSELDLTRQSMVEQFFKDERPEYVFLAAAKVGGILANSTYPAEFIYQNLLIESNIIHSAHECGTKKLLFLGSSCIYPRNCPQPMKEEYLLTDVLEKTNEAYAIAKITGIKLCEYFNRQYGDEFISVMPTNLYGPNDNFDLETSHVLPALIRKFHEGKAKWEKSSESERQNISVTIWGTGKARREFLHVDDMVKACIFVMNHVRSIDIYGQGISHINIGTGEDLTISELCEIIREIVGFPGKIIYDNQKPDGTPRKLLNITRIKNLGWESRISLKRGIKDAYDWYLSENI
jgi:GDP-L-fucose synthase